MNKKAKFFIIAGLFVAAIPAGMYTVVEGQVVSGSVSYPLPESSVKHNLLNDRTNFESLNNPQPAFSVKGGVVYIHTNGSAKPLEFSEGIWDKLNNIVYYTEKDPAGWGSKEYIFGYSLSDQRIQKKIRFDNSGYFKYPISINSDSTKLVMAERAQSVGEVSLSVIDINNEVEVKQKDKVHSPKIEWINSREYTYDEMPLECTKSGCIQKIKNTKRLNLDTQSTTIIESRDLEAKNSEGNPELNISEKL